jgi:GDP/UDP-N,N'-diacetylbacillosamine 2-epimerase (hydrolysing)
LRRKICAISGSRAEFSLLRGVLEKISLSKKLKLQLIVTGSHLSRSHGLTIGEIQHAGLIPDIRVPLPGIDTGEKQISEIMGAALTGLGKAMVKLRPDMVLLLGDRYETFCAAAAATALQIPVAHIHGGEVTAGSFDDAFRHAITKMSQLHFTATKLARRRVIQMGEHPDTVFWVGAPGLDGIETRGRMTRAELEKSLNLRFQKKNLLVTYHPATRERGKGVAQIRELCAALHHFPNVLIVFTGVNQDPEGRKIQAEIDNFTSAHSHARFVASMGGERYLSFLRQADVVVGNSSSALLEAPSVGCWALNIGSRQNGRERAGNVIDVECRRGLIRHHVAFLLRRDRSRQKRHFRNPYAKEGSVRNIVKILEQNHLAGSLQKNFYNGIRPRD